MKALLKLWQVLITISTVLLPILKWSHAIHWSWWWVLSPIWGSIAIVIIYVSLRSEWGKK